ncbi:hypothetical protein COSO111634_34960 [Corallococcus soli]
MAARAGDADVGALGDGVAVLAVPGVAEDFGGNAAVPLFGVASSLTVRVVPTLVPVSASVVVLAAGALATTWKGIRTRAPRVNSAPLSQRRDWVGTTSTCSSMRSLLCSA